MQTLQRSAPFNESFASPVLSGPQTLADFGKYFTETNATPGTPVSYAISAAYSATVALFTFRNGGANGAPRIYLDYVRLILGTAPASATAAHYATYLDNTVRGSAGTTLAGMQPNLDTNTSGNFIPSVADFRYTPTVAAASAGAYQHSRGVVRSVIPVTNDEYLFTFGRNDMPGTISDLAGTTAKRIVIPCPPLILGAGANQTGLLHLWFPGNSVTAASFEYEVGWFER